MGLIGGAVALGFRDRGAEVTAWDPDSSVRERVSESGVEVAESLASAVRGAGFVFVCGPVGTIVDTVRVADKAATDAIITDVASVKGPVVSTLREAGLRNCFIGGHPMAGSEKSGFTAAIPRLLHGAAWVLTVPRARELPDFRLLASTLLDVFGVRLVPLTPVRHDKAVAVASHLPHLLAATLANVAATSEVRDLVLSLAAGSFRDGTRVAGGPPRRTTQIVSGNRDQVALLRDAVLNEVTAFFDALDQADPQPLQQRFAHGAALRNDLLAADLVEIEALFGPDDADRELAWLDGLGSAGGHVVSCGERGGGFAYQAHVPSRAHL